jgi:hypothetical protein
MHPPSSFSVDVGIAAWLVAMSYIFWTGWGRVTYFALFASAITYAGIAILGLVVGRAADDHTAPSDETFDAMLRSLDAMIVLWWFMFGCAVLAAGAASVRCWRQTGSPLPFHRRRKRVK